MSTVAEPIRKLPAGSVVVAPARMFTYPTCLADSWTPKSLEILLPGYTLERPEIAITVRQDSTRSLNYPVRNPLKRFRKQLSAEEELPDGHVYDARWETDGNIAHILAYIAAPLLAARQTLGKITVILRANASVMGKKAFALLGFPTHCTDKHVSGKLVLAPDGTSGKYEAHIPALYGEVTWEGYRPDTPDRVFISRKGDRALINEAEVEAVLREHGFSKYYFEDIPISEQWSVSRNARAIVAIHGAAVASALFNRQRAKLLELFHPGYIVDIYRNMINVLGGSWAAVTGQMPENIITELDVKRNGRAFAALPAKIDVESLRKALAYLEVEPR